MAEAAAVDDRGGPPRPQVLRRSSLRLLAIFGLSGFAISQPVLSLFGENPVTIAHHGVDGGALVVFALLVVLVPPLALWAVGQLAGWCHETAGRIVHLLTVWLLASAAALQGLRSIGMSDRPAILLAPAMAAALTVAYARARGVRTWLTYTAVLPVLALGAFLLTSPASALLHSAAAPDLRATDRPSVVVIVLDELPTRSLLVPDGSLDAARFPTLAHLTEEFTWYRHHTAMAPFTDMAVPSVLTGRRPTMDPPLWTSHPDNLFTMLAPTHRLEVMETATRLCPYSHCEPTAGARGPALGALLGEVTRSWIDRVSPDGPEPSRTDDFAEVVDAPVDPPGGSATVAPSGSGFVPDDAQMRATSVRADRFRSTFDPAAGSTLYYLHLMLPHQPWRFWPDGTMYGDPDTLRLALPPDDWDVRESWSDWESYVSEQRNVLQTEYVDRLLGEILGDLEATGLYDSSMVVITADHGMSFELRTPGRTVIPTTVDAIAYTPLFVKLPHQAEGGVDDSNAMAFDVLPTIADALDLDTTWDVDGRALGSPEQRARGPRKVFHDVGVVDQRREERPVLEYDDGDVWPTVPHRQLGPLVDPADHLSALHALLPVPGLIGTPVDDLRSRGTAGSISLIGVEELRRPEDAPFGIAYGAVEGPREDDVVLLCIDGTVVAGSEVSTDTSGTERVTFVIPQGSLDHENEISAVVLDGDAVRTLTVTED
jgi:hypothetical protein